MKFYRLVYKNGNRGAWSSDYNYIKKMAEIFEAEIEVGEMHAWDIKIIEILV